MENYKFLGKYSNKENDSLKTRKYKKLISNTETKEMTQVAQKTESRRPGQAEKHRSPMQVKLLGLKCSKFAKGVQGS